MFGGRTGRLVKVVIALVFMVGMVGWTGQVASAARTWPVQRIGDSGENIVTIQYMLRFKNYTVVADGVFGSGTETAVKQFQSARGLTADGIVGALTWEQLAYQVSLGSNNIVVTAAQRQLKNKYGYSTLATDGIFGSGTEAAVKDFQGKNAIVQNGIVGLDTWAALTNGGGGGGGTRAQLAAQIRDSSRIGLATSHPSGNSDNAYARNNIVDTANGLGALRLSYYCSDTGSYAPGGRVFLSTALLQGMLNMASTYTYFVTEIAGACHSVGSRHYDGVAFDIGTINGSGVSSSNPYYSAFMSKCSSLGATEILGPGDAGHSTHVHCAWPRP